VGTFFETQCRLATQNINQSVTTEVTYTHYILSI